MFIVLLYIICFVFNIFLFLWMSRDEEKIDTIALLAFAMTGFFSVFFYMCKYIDEIKNPFYKKHNKNLD